MRPAAVAWLRGLWGELGEVHPYVALIGAIVGTVVIVGWGVRDRQGPFDRMLLLRLLQDVMGALFIVELNRRYL